MKEAHVEWIIANTINETARGDPDALAARIVEALAQAGYSVAPGEDAEGGSQPFDELAPEQRPQDPYGDGRDWKFETGERGGHRSDNMPQMIRATDRAGRWAVYVPLTRGGKIVVPRRTSPAATSPRSQPRENPRCRETGSNPRSPQEKRPLKFEQP